MIESKPRVDFSLLMKKFYKQDVEFHENSTNRHKSKVYSPKKSIATFFTMFSFVKKVSIRFVNSIYGLN